MMLIIFFYKLIINRIEMEKLFCLVAILLFSLTALSATKTVTVDFTK